MPKSGGAIVPQYTVYTIVISCDHVVFSLCSIVTMTVDQRFKYASYEPHVKLLPPTIMTLNTLHNYILPNRGMDTNT